MSFDFFVINLGNKHVFSFLDHELASYGLFSIDTCTQDFKLQKLLEAYRHRSALENEQQPLRAMTTLNSMVTDFLGIYDLTPLSVNIIRRIPYLARCANYDTFLEAGTNFHT